MYQKYKLETKYLVYKYLNFLISGCKSINIKVFSKKKGIKSSLGLLFAYFLGLVIAYQQVGTFYFFFNG